MRSYERLKLIIFLGGAIFILCTAVLYALWNNAIFKQQQQAAQQYQLQILTIAATTWTERMDRLLFQLSHHHGLNEVLKQTDIDNIDIAKQLNEVIRDPLVIPHTAISLVSLANEWIYTNTGLSLAYFDQMVSQQALRADHSIVIYPNTYTNQSDLLLLRAMSDDNSYRKALVAIHMPISFIEQYIREQAQLEHIHMQLLLPDDNRNSAYRGAELEAAGLPAQATVIPLANTHLALAWWTDEVAFDKPFMHIVIIIPLLLLWAFGSWYVGRRIQLPFQQLIDDYDMSVKPQASPAATITQYINQQHLELSDLQEQLNGFIPDLKLSTFQHLLWGELTEHELVDRVNRLKLPLTGESFYITVASIDEYTHFLTQHNKQDQLHIHHQLRAQAFDIFTGPFNVVTFTPRHGLITVLIGVPKTIGEPDKLLASLCDQYREWVRQHYPFTMSITISRPRRGYSSFSASYHEALALMSDRMTLGNDVTIAANDRQQTVIKPNHSVMQQCKHTARLIMQGQTAEATIEVDALLEVIGEQNYKSETALGIFAHLIGELEYMLFELHIHIHDIFEDNIYDVLYAKSTLIHVRDWLIETVCGNITAYLSKQHISRQKQLAQQVIHQIHDHYDKDIALQQVAEQLTISVSQLSRVFKEETGKTFSESLIQYRMQKSAELLENTDMSIKEIAEKMRYTNVQNFSRIFKQIIGVPPGEYRKQVKEL